MNVSSAAYENNGQPVASAPAPIVAIRQALIAADDRRERVWKRQVPAWMISGGIHIVRYIPLYWAMKPGNSSLRIG